MSQVLADERLFGRAIIALLRTVITHLEGETGLERVTFVLRGDALDAFRRRLATL